MLTDEICWLLVALEESIRIRMEEKHRSPGLRLLRGLLVDSKTTEIHLKCDTTLRYTNKQNKLKRRSNQIDRGGTIVTSLSIARQSNFN